MPGRYSPYTVKPSVTYVTEGSALHPDTPARIQIDEKTYTSLTDYVERNQERLGTLDALKIGLYLKFAQNPEAKKTLMESSGVFHLDSSWPELPGLLVENRRIFQAA